MKRPDNPLTHSHIRHLYTRSDAVTKVLSLFAVAALACSCLLSTGCDLGTYNKRLNEAPVAPAAEEPATDADSETEDEPSDDQ